MKKDIEKDNEKDDSQEGVKVKRVEKESPTENLAENISEKVVEKFAEFQGYNSDIQTIQELKGFLKKEKSSFDESMKFTKVSHPEVHDYVKGMLDKDISSFTKEEASKVANSTRSLFKAEEGISGLFKKKDENSKNKDANSSEKTLDSNFVDSTMSSISGENVSTSNSNNHIDSAVYSDEFIHDHFPPSAAAIQQLNDNNKRVSDYKKWDYAKLAEVEHTNKVKPREAYSTMTPDRYKLIQDLSPEAKKNALYSPRKLSQSTFSIYHGINNSPFDKSVEAEMKHKANVEIAEVINSNMLRETVPGTKYSTI